MCEEFRVLIVGGTHGNELTGVHLIQYWQRQPDEIKRSGIHTELLLASPRAVELHRRYVDCDLNRCFSESSLNQPDSSACYDLHRAREINRLYGPKGSSQAVDLVIDIHNSTSNMGLSIILNQPNALTQRLSALLAQEFPAVRLLQEPRLGPENPFLPSISKADITIEVGPQPHGTLEPLLLLQTRQLVLRLLDLLSLSTHESLPKQPIPVTVFRQGDEVDYPRFADGALSAMIHPDRLGQDYQAMNPGDPIFMDFQGQTIAWQGQETFYPIFIGEAAYLEKGIALILTRMENHLW